MDTHTYELEAGQGLALPLQRGDQLVLLRGTLCAQAPWRWLDDSALALPPQCWSESHTLTVQDGGCWQWHALSRATLAVQRRAPWWRAAAAATTAWLRRAAPQSSRMQST